MQGVSYWSDEWSWSDAARMSRRKRIDGVEVKELCVVTFGRLTAWGETWSDAFQNLAHTIKAVEGRFGPRGIEAWTDAVYEREPPRGDPTPEGETPGGGE